MKRNIWLIVLVLCAFIACNEAAETPTTATISGTVTNPGDIEKVEVLSSPVVGDRATIAEAEIAEDGTFSLTIPATEPMDARLRIGKESASVFIHPGDAMTLSIDTEAFDESLSYEGEGSVVNNYLASKLLKEEEYQESLEESNIFKLELDDFLAAHNGL